MISVLNKNKTGQEEKGIPSRMDTILYQMVKKGHTEAILE